MPATVEVEGGWGWGWIIFMIIIIFLFIILLAANAWFLSTIAYADVATFNNGSIDFINQGTATTLFWINIVFLILIIIFIIIWLIWWATSTPTVEVVAPVEPAVTTAPAVTQTVTPAVATVTPVAPREVIVPNNLQPVYYTPAKEVVYEQIPAPVTPVKVPTTSVVMTQPVQQVPQYLSSPSILTQPSYYTAPPVRNLSSF